MSTIAAHDAFHSKIVEFAKTIEKESAKPSIAAANAFVLVRWSSRLLQDTAGRQALWTDAGKVLLRAMINALDTLLGYSGKEGTISTAYRVCWRALRAIAKSSFGEAALNESIDMLIAKTTTPVPRNALGLGMIAGVCRRLSGLEHLVAARKKDYVDFYLKEILSSKVVLPNHRGAAMSDFFTGYVLTQEDLQPIIAAVERLCCEPPKLCSTISSH